MSSGYEQLRSIYSNPKKRFGQNFLHDRQICYRIVNKIPLEKGSQVIEIGPGLGALTEQLLEAGYKVKAYEIDHELVDHLRSRFNEHIGKDLSIENEDALKVLGGSGNLKDQFLISNLPYNISSAIMGTLLDSIDLNDRRNELNGAIIMFQKEFGRRLTALPGGKDFGKISVMFSLKMEHEVLFTVPRDRFYPPPKVDGIVIRFWPRKDPENIPLDDGLLRSLVSMMFSSRRKKIKNSIQISSLNIDLELETFDGILEDMGIIDERPEHLAPSIFVELSNRISREIR